MRPGDDDKPLSSSDRVRVAEMCLEQAREVYSQHKVPPLPDEATLAEALRYLTERQTNLELRQSYLEMGLRALLPGASFDDVCEQVQRTRPALRVVDGGKGPEGERD